jgi:hypothetical protein
MPNQENTRTPKPDSNQRQPPQQEQQAGGNKAEKRNKTADQQSQDRRMAPGQSAKEHDGTRH